MGKLTIPVPQCYGISQLYWIGISTVFWYANSALMYYRGHRGHIVGILYGH
jgi:hypothetical protein